MIVPMRIHIMPPFPVVILAAVSSVAGALAAAPVEPRQDWQVLADWSLVASLQGGTLV